MATSHRCVVCNQPWPEGLYRSAKEQDRRVSAACTARGGLDEAPRDIEHLLFAALRVLNDDTEDDTEEAEEHRRWVIETLLEYAQGACERLKESSEALWNVTALYLWPTTPKAKKAAEVDTAETNAMEQQE